MKSDGNLLLRAARTQRCAGELLCGHVEKPKTLLTGVIVVKQDDEARGHREIHEIGEKVASGIFKNSMMKFATMPQWTSSCAALVLAQILRTIFTKPCPTEMTLVHFARPAVWRE